MLWASLFTIATLIGSSIAAKLPAHSLGFYVLIADDTVENYTSTDVWTPNLYDYQINGANTFYLTFVNPKTMDSPPPAMVTLAKCKGSGQTGCPTSDQVVLFSVGGYSYSLFNWPFLASESAAKSMAQTVCNDPGWQSADGIDLDIETGAGNGNSASNNLVAFATELKSLCPDYIVTSPQFGYPQVDAEIAMVNNGWKKSGNSYVPTGIVDAISLMVYQNLESLQYVKDYGNATSEWDGFPITVDVPYGSIIPGLQGSASASTINQMAQSIKSERLGGFMVWLASCYDATHDKNAFTYGGGAGDATKFMDKTGTAWAQALATINS